MHYTKGSSRIQVPTRLLYLQMVNSRDYARIVENKDARQLIPNPRRTIQQVKTKKRKAKVSNFSIAASTLDKSLLSFVVRKENEGKERNWQVCWYF